MGFTESVFALLPRLFSYNPTLSAAQFLRRGFAEQKMLLIRDVCHLVETEERQDREAARAAKRKFKLGTATYVSCHPRARVRRAQPVR